MISILISESMHLIFSRKCEHRSRASLPPKVATILLTLFLISNFLYESFDELGSNVFRYNLPICFALCYGSILLIDQKKNIKLLQ